MNGYVGGIYAGGCIETLTHIGQLEARYEGIVVDAANGQLWATQDGYLFQFTYPGLVNTQGPGVPYYDDSANNLSTGAPALDDLGNVYYVDANAGGGEHQTLYKVQPGGSRTTVNTRSGHHAILDLCWSHDDGTGTPALFGAEQINPGDLYRIDSSSWAVVHSTTVPSNTGSSPPVATADGAVWRIIQIPGDGRVAIRYRNGSAHEYNETATHQYDVTFPLALCSRRIVWRGDDLDGTWQLFSAIYPDDFSGDPQPYDDDALKALLALYGDGWQAFPTPTTCKVAYLAFPDEAFTTAIYERTCCGSTPAPPELGNDYTMLFLLYEILEVAPTVEVPGFTLLGSRGLGRATLLMYFRQEATSSAPDAFFPDRQSAVSQGPSVTLPGPNGADDVVVTFTGFDPEPDTGYTAEAIHVVGAPTIAHSGSGTVGPAISPIAIPTTRGLGPVLVVGASDAAGPNASPPNMNVQVAETSTPHPTFTWDEGGSGAPVQFFGPDYVGSFSFRYEIPHPSVSDPSFKLSAIGQTDFFTAYWYEIGFA